VSWFPYEVVSVTTLGPASSRLVPHSAACFSVSVPNWCHGETASKHSTITSGVQVLPLF